MKVISVTLMSTALLAGVAVPSYADSLLGGVLGGKDDKALVTIGSGDAGDSGLINLGVGGDNQVLDVNVGNGDAASATVGSGGDRGLVNADVDLINDNVSIDANVGGGDRAVDVNIGIGGGGNGNGGDGGGGGGGDGGGNGGGGDGGGNGGGGNGGGGNGGGNGGGGNGGGNGGGGNGGGVLPPSSGSSNTSSSDPVCAGISVSQLDRLLRSTRIDGSWQRASNVAVQRVQLCPDEQTWLASALASTGLGYSLQSAIVNDALLSASLSRSSFGPDRVFAVQRNGNQLTVYVY